MAKPTGFLEYQQELPTERAIADRIQDWQPFYLSLPDEKLQVQGARCMDCGIPFCHKGRILNKMTSGCPINNLIPEWNDLVYLGRWRDALERLHKTNNFPEFTGRVCPAPCEAACTLGIHHPPVTIKSIECAIVDKGFEQGWITPDPPTQRTGKSVAVVGSGPAGLACAAQLNRAGHWVTVFERANRIGGLLMYGIPNMKLDKGIVQRRVDLLAAEGIQFVTNTAVGQDYPVDQLRQDFDAIVLCTGATVPRDLPVPGRPFNGIHMAMDYLEANTRHLLNPSQPLAPPLSATGKDVIVIGGGDTGTDCVATAIRQGCRSLVQFEIMARPPARRAPDNPWPQWARVYKLDYGQEEAAAVWGQDPRTYSLMTQTFTGDDSGHVQAAHTVQITWEPEADGRLTLKEIPGTEENWPAQLVLLAMGFLGPESELLDQLHIKRTDRSTIQAEQYRTNIDGIFAAGDARRGQSLVVWAIHEGRGAARACDHYLMGETHLI